MHCHGGRCTYDAQPPNFARQTTLTTAARSAARWRSALLGLLGCLLLGLGGCGTYEDQRIREMMVEKGFGTRADGDATHENYVNGRDWVQFLVPPEAMVFPGYERLGELTAVQPVRIDGTIHVPYVGPVYVLGMTEKELSALVKAQLRLAGLDAELDIQGVIQPGRTKFFYAIGETLAKGPVELVADMRLWDAMFTAKWTPLANLGRVYLIRPDAEHPLVVDINFREMLMSGYTGSNFPIREHDVIYVPPTFLGLVARLLERLLQPVGLAVRTMLGAAQITTAYDVLSGRSNGLFFRY